MPGIRALAIFSCALPLVILRIAHSHVGTRTSNSPFETLSRNIWPLATLETILTYIFSAWLFSQIYLFSLPDDSNLRWITYHMGDRPRINERALFYTVNLVVLGAVEGFIHLALDYDRLRLGTVAPKPEGQENTPPQSDPWVKLTTEAPRFIFRAGLVSIAVGLVNYVILYSLLRYSAWGWALSAFRLFYNLPRTNIPPNQAPWSIFMLARSMWAGFLVCLLWDIGGLVFNVQLQREPLKNNQPLTSESKDPNGSLLNGLKSKKDRVQVSTDYYPRMSQY
jgi:nucleoporin NDC1